MTTLSVHLGVTSRSASALVEQCRTQIDKDTAALLESVRVLRSRRNDLARISCLPPEILATVFKYIADEEVLKSYPGHTPENTPRYCAPACLIVTHVCRHWRQVALDFPALWASINCASARWLPMMLERSKNDALVVTYSAQALQPCLEQVLSQLPRIKVLQLCLFSYSEVDVVLDCLSSQPAPLLQTFRLSHCAGLHHSAKPWPISDTIFQGRVPRLRSVELVYCPFNWTSCIFSGLRTLDVRDTGFVFTSSELLSALRRMPDLEQLSLRRLLIFPEETQLLGKFPLSQLKHIALDYILPLTSVVTLFAHLALPIDVTVALNLAGTVQGPQSFSELLSAMDKDPNEFGSIIRSLRTSVLYGELGIQFSTSMTFRSNHSWNPRDDNIYDDDIRLSIQFESGELQPGVVFDASRIIAQHKIQNLFVSSLLTSDLPENFWRAGSVNLPELKVIHLTGPSVGGLIATLCIEGAQTSDIMYPSLHAIELENIDFEFEEPEKLWDIITMRAKHGACIRRLRFAMCMNLMAKQVQLLEEVVADVDWDGHEESTESSKRDSYTCTWNQYPDSDEDSED
ncbi:uncharacterized protein EDB91DRAFT_1202856 [Suillus paluster]|uniref:uncharacterized protein n=1 Tax=Suillus paluster TaxID=48578 RepID=UPI001B874CE8|nr:uncharacterized protein EDB91DRAFT_1202856 [Suillus paluster]KAG1739492.1 hypothetical protein EDB91DRAFT_1202856 [Suillus paluster]